MRFLTAFLVAALLAACRTDGHQSEEKRIGLVRVDGQREAVPAEWITTPEGQFAHSIKLPRPLAERGPYRVGISPNEYFQDLCSAEAGQFIYRTVQGVDGFYFMRPPRRPTDDDLQDLYKLEAPDIERLFQLYRPTPGDRSTIFVVPGVRHYRYIEEKNPRTGLFERANGFVPGTTRPKELDTGAEPHSKYGVTWRGIKRDHDRENRIAGSEWIVIEIGSNEVLGVFRNYVRTGGVANTTRGVWWLNGVQCPNTQPAASAAWVGQQVYEFLARVLIPSPRLP